MNAQYLAQINKFLPELLIRIKAKYTPIPVIIHPERDAVINSCFYNVGRKVAKDGGSTTYGWAIMPLKYMIEAEKHAIGKTPEGSYLDITPTIHPIQQTLFVIDDDFVYSGQLVDNVRINISENKVVDDWILVCETINSLYSYGRRTTEYEIVIPENLVTVLKGLENFVKVFEPYLDASGDYNSPCFCGRQIPYRKCHDRDLRQTLAETLIKVKTMMKQ